MPRKPQSIAGQTFGRLTAVEEVGHNKHGFILWSWNCVCGAQITAPAYPIKTGAQVSCGCFRDEQSHLRARHGMWKSRTYRAWIEMKARCRGKDESSRRNYADRGITVAANWQNDFEQFFADMGVCPDGMTCERIDNERGYELGNCRWATQHDQTRNTRRTVRVQVGDTQMCLKDACSALGLNYDAVRSRIRLGRSPQQAIAY